MIPRPHAADDLACCGDAQDLRAERAISRKDHELACARAGTGADAGRRPQRGRDQSDECRPVAPTRLKFQNVQIARHPGTQFARIIQLAGHRASSLKGWSVSRSAPRTPRPNLRRPRRGPVGVMLITAISAPMFATTPWRSWCRIAGSSGSSPGTGTGPTTSPADVHLSKDDQTASPARWQETD